MLYRNTMKGHILLVCEELTASGYSFSVCLQRKCLSFSVSWHIPTRDGHISIAGSPHEGLSWWESKGSFSGMQIAHRFLGNTAICKVTLSPKTWGGGGCVGTFVIHICMEKCALCRREKKTNLIKCSDWKTRRSRSDEAFCCFLEIKLLQTMVVSSRETWMGFECLVFGHRVPRWRKFGETEWIQGIFLTNVPNILGHQKKKKKALLGPGVLCLCVPMFS